jgi:long-chain acyl-CoA synthetase
LSQAVVQGDGRPYVTALCTLSQDANLALGRELHADDPRELCRHPEVERRVEHLIEAVNARLAPHECIRRFAIVHPDFAVGTGELTPTLKLRRQAVIDKYRSLLETLYAGH